jgi:hypothetical protein
MFGQAVGLEGEVTRPGEDHFPARYSTTREESEDEMRSV